MDNVKVNDNNSNEEIHYVDIDDITKVSDVYKEKLLSAIINFVNSSPSYEGFSTKFDNSNRGVLKFTVAFHYYTDNSKNIYPVVIDSKIPDFELKVSNNSFFKDYRYPMVSWNYVLVLKPRNNPNQYVVRYNKTYSLGNNIPKKLNDDTWLLYDTCHHINESNNLEIVNNMTKVFSQIMGVGRGKYDND